jgi:hypothetical protein
LATVAVTVLTTVVGLAMGWLQHWVRRASFAVSTRIKFDHSTIGTGWINGQTGSLPEFVIEVKCAPSRRIQEPQSIDPQALLNFVQLHFDGTFPPVPEHNSPDSTRYATDRNQAEKVQQFAQFFKEGLIETRLSIPHGFDDEGRPVLSLVDVMDRVVPFMVGVQQGAFHRLFGTDRRLDWYFGLSQALQADSWTPWQSLVFPGAEPGTRATGMHGPYSQVGFGSQHLRELKQSKPVDEILMIALTDLVNRSGYIDTEKAMIDIRKAIIERVNRTG